MRNMQRQQKMRMNRIGIESMGLLGQKHLNGICIRTTYNRRRPSVVDVCCGGFCRRNNKQILTD